MVAKGLMYIITLYKLYAVPVRICITCESYPQYQWVISSVPMSHIVSTREDVQYPWVISSVPKSHILSTHEDMQYPWVISSVPVRICSTRESYPQYPWVISSVPMSHIFSTHESYHQYPWGYALPVSYILDSFEQASEIKCPKLVTKYQNDSKAEFTGSPSATEPDSDSAGGTEGEDKISASSVIYSSKSS